MIGGAERQAEKLAVALVNRGCHVEILTPRVDPVSPSREVVGGVDIERFEVTDLARRYPVSGIATLNVPAMLWQIGSTVARRLEGVDVLHCHLGSLQTVAAAVAGRMARIPVICKAAIAYERSDLGVIERTGASGPFISWMARRFIDTWVATTGAVEEALNRAGVVPERIVRIPNGVETPGLPCRRPDRSVRHFLYLGRLSTNIQRDVPSLIRAFDRLAGVHDDAELAIVGDGDLFGETRQLAGRCAARRRITMPGFDDPDKWIAWADCLVLPSRYEGLSNALLEAMAAGLACVANDIAPNREVLANGQAGILVPVGDAEALERAMRLLAESPAEASRYRQQALERCADHYSIEAVAERYLKLYRDLSRPHQPGSPSRRATS
jgi:glycosyltransferase involved in cell wall biosynthesis